MPAPRELEVTWGSITLGGSTARQITDYTIHEEDYPTGYFECKFVTTAADADAMKTEIDALVTAFRTPRLDLTVKMGDKEILHRWQSDNTGLDTTPIIAKNGDPADTSRSRHFAVRVAYGLPADVVDTDFRKGSDINVSIGANGIRTLTITGTYTANSYDGTTGAYEQYDDQIAAYALSCITFIDPGGANTRWELIGEPQILRNETNKVCSFTIIYREIIYAQAIGIVNDPAIVDPMLTFSITRIAPGDSKGLFLNSAGNTGQTITASAVVRPNVLTINYSCVLDKNITTDLESKYATTIRPFLLQQAGRYSPGGVLLLVAENPNYGDVYSNHFTATLVFHSYTGNILSQTVTVQDSTNFGKILRPVWNGDPFSFYEYQGSMIRVKTILEEREQLESIGADVMDVINRFTSAVQLTDQNWLLVSRTPKGDVKIRGIEDGTGQQAVATLAIETVFQYRKKTGSSTPTTGGGGSQQGGDVASPPSFAAR